MTAFLQQFATIMIDHMEQQLQQQQLLQQHHHHHQTPTKKHHKINHHQQQQSTDLDDEISLVTKEFNTEKR